MRRVTEDPVRNHIRVGILVLAGLLAASAAAAQERSSPQLFITINGGAVFGGDLWTVDKQPVAIIGAPLTEPDTMRIARRIEPGLAAGLTFTVFPWGNLGISFEAMYLGQGLDDACTMVYEDEAADPQRRNAQVCRSIGGKESTAATSSFLLGAFYRFTPRGAFSPFLRAQAGISLRGESVVEVSGFFLDQGTGITQDRIVIPDPSGSTTAFSAAFSAGVMIPISSGYAVTLELRDHLIQMQRVLEPWDPRVSRAPVTDSFLDHAFTFTVGFSIVLERKRGRRY
jgi:hypothetical protein